MSVCIVGKAGGFALYRLHYAPLTLGTRRRKYSLDLEDCKGFEELLYNKMLDIFQGRTPLGTFQS